MDYDEAKSEVLTLHPAQVMAGRVQKLANYLTAEAGLVAFDAEAPQGVRWNDHKPNFLLAVYTALAFVAITLRGEWLVLGRAATVILRSLPEFEQVEGMRCHGTCLYYVGKLRTITVYTMDTLPTEAWLAGCLSAGDLPDNLLCCRGLIQHCPANFAPPVRYPLQTPVDAGMWRALQAAVNRVELPVLDENGDEDD